MKTLLLILFISIGTVKAQTTYDTSATLVPVIDGTKYYFIYDATGKLIDRVIKVQSWSVPTGGSSSKSQLIDGTQLWLVGYVINKTIKTDSTYSTNAIGYLAGDRKSKIPAPYLVNQLRKDMPVNGFDFKP